MSVSIPDVLAPLGRIEPHLFPGEGDGTSGSALYRRLTGYLADATEQTYGMGSPDAAVKEWIYYRAFDAAALAMVRLPNQIDQANEGGHAYTADQRKEMRRQADQAKAAFEALVREDAVSTPAPPVNPVSRTTVNCYGY